MIQSPNDLYSGKIKAIILSKITEIVHFILLPYVLLEKSILFWRDLIFLRNIVFEVYIEYFGGYESDTHYYYYYIA